MLLDIIFMLLQGEIIIYIAAIWNWRNVILYNLNIQCK